MVMPVPSFSHPAVRSSRTQGILTAFETPRLLHSATRSDVARHNSANATAGLPRCNARTSGAVFAVFSAFESQLSGGMNLEGLLRMRCVGERLRCCNRIVAG